MARFQLHVAIYLTIFFSFVFMIITAWDDLFDLLFRRMTGLPEDSIRYRLTAALFFTALGYLVLWIIDEDFAYLYGLEDVMGPRKPTTATTTSPDSPTSQVVPVSTDPASSSNNRLTPHMVHMTPHGR